MKKLLSLLLILTLCLPLAACGKKNEGVVASLPDGLSGAGQKILILYYSTANTNGVDVVSAATPYFDCVASTELLALAIQKLVGGDLAKLTPVQDYPESYNDTTAAAKKERDDDQRPAFVPLEVDPEDYDVIFVGYPMWWYTLRRDRAVRAERDGPAGSGGFRQARRQSRSGREGMARRARFQRLTFFVFRAMGCDENAIPVRIPRLGLDIFKTPCYNIYAKSANGPSGTVRSNIEKGDRNV